MCTNLSIIVFKYIFWFQSFIHERTLLRPNERSQQHELVCAAPLTPLSPFACDLHLWVQGQLQPLVLVLPAALHEGEDGICVRRRGQSLEEETEEWRTGRIPSRHDPLLLQSEQCNGVALKVASGNPQRCGRGRVNSNPLCIIFCATLK